jgi:hypothetical protein
MAPLALDAFSRCQLEQLAMRLSWLGPRALADYLTQIANPNTVITMLDVARDYDGWLPDHETMRTVVADRFPPKLWVVPSDLGEERP